MSEGSGEVPAFACCSAGIGRWFWAAWESESDARACAPAVASGYEATAARAEARAVERVGAELKKLPGKWASGYRNRGKEGDPASVGATRPKARIGRPRPAPGTPTASVRLAFLYAAEVREPPDAMGHVAVARHRIVKQTARKILVDCEPFDADEWARRREEAPEDLPKTRTLAVDRVALRAEGRFTCRHAQRDLTFYATEDDGIRDIEAVLTAKHDWCATLGVRFPCSVETIKAAYRRLAIAAHPDAGGDPADFRAIESAYREALAYLAPAGESG